MAAERSRPGERFTFAFAETPVERLLVVMSETGVVEVTFVASDRETDADALAFVASRYPDAVLEPHAGTHDNWVAAVAAYVDDAAKAPPVPLDLRGTDFQLSVWRALLEIPAGQTRSYAEIARRIGRPTAFRAVAQACGANPVGVVVPCHRVIGSNGSLTGYAGGLHYKRALLEREGVRV